MKTLKCHEISKGMRVVLTAPDNSYNINETNPEVGTVWECIGTVASCSSGSISVVWDNGCSNSYKDNELSASYEGRCKSIW